MMKRFLFLPLALLTLTVSAPARAQADRPAAAADSPTLPQEDLVIRGANGTAHPFHVELALGPLDQMHGLMNRTSMAPNAGMLFVFTDEQPREFWMKDTLIPLDMLFIHKDGTIASIHENAIPKDETAIPSQGAVMAVLELNGGTAAKLGIKAGDRAYDRDYFKNVPAQ